MKISIFRFKTFLAERKIAAESFETLTAPYSNLQLTLIQVLDIFAEIAIQNVSDNALEYHFSLQLLSIASTKIFFTIFTLSR